MLHRDARAPAAHTRTHADVDTDSSDSFDSSESSTDDEGSELGEELHQGHPHHGTSTTESEDALAQLYRQALANQRKIVEETGQLVIFLSSPFNGLRDERDIFINRCVHAKHRIIDLFILFWQKAHCVRCAKICHPIVTLERMCVCVCVSCSCTSRSHVSKHRVLTHVQNLVDDHAATCRCCGARLRTKV